MTNFTLVKIKKRNLRNIVFIFLSLILFFGCKQTQRPKRSIILKTQNQVIVNNFQKALEITEKLIETRFSKSEFSDYFSINTRATGFDYGSVIYSLKDSLKEIPKGYQIYYDFIIENDTISSFRVDLDSTLKVNYYRLYHLIGFKLFVDNELKIKTYEALQIAKKYAIDGSGVSAIFHASREYPDTIDCNQVRFYWVLQKDCDGCNFIEIDAKSGIVYRKGEVIYEY